MASRSEMASRMGYPRRPKYFACRVMRVLTKECVAQTLGRDVFVLLSVIAFQEDTIHYTGPVSFYTEQLLPLCGFPKWDQLQKARNKAIEAGWLQFESGGVGTRQPGWYYVTVPSDLDSINDNSIDEGEEFITDNTHNSTHDNTQKQVLIGGMNGGMNEVLSGVLNRGMSGGISNPVPIPVPVPNTPLPPTGEEERQPDQSPKSQKARKKPPVPVMTEEEEKQVLELYGAYPKRNKRKEALPAILAALRKVGFGDLMEAVQEYARCAGLPGNSNRFCPDPVRWFGQERWTDDRKLWQSDLRDEETQQGKGNPYHATDSRQRKFKYVRPSTSTAESGSGGDSGRDRPESSEVPF